MILPNFANHPQRICHLPWQLPVWQNWQTFANHKYGLYWKATVFDLLSIYDDLWGRAPKSSFFAGVSFPSSLRRSCFAPYFSPMAHTLLWPKKSFFYPIGNTAAVSLVQDLSPEEDAKILLLGCGDPRNILYTTHASGADSAICRLSLCYALMFKFHLIALAV